MDNIFDRIWKARIPLLRERKKPTTVYLGWDEYGQLWGAVEGDAAFVPAAHTTSGRDQVFGLDVFEVNAQNHLRVV